MITQKVQGQNNLTENTSDYFIPVPYLIWRKKQDSGSDKLTNNKLIRYFHEYEHLITSFQPLDGILNNYNSDDSSNMESTENEEINNKIVTELFQPDSVKVIDNEESPIITLSPVNDQVLKYLSEYPESFY